MIAGLQPWIFAVIPKTFNKWAASLCFWAGICCWGASAYYFLIAPIDYVALAILLFGTAIALQLIASVINRRANAQLENERADESDQG